MDDSMRTETQQFSGWSHEAVGGDIPLVDPDVVEEGRP